MEQAEGGETGLLSGIEAQRRESAVTGAAHDRVPGNGIRKPGDEADALLGPGSDIRCVVKALPLAGGDIQNSGSPGQHGGCLLPGDGAARVEGGGGGTFDDAQSVGCQNIGIVGIRKGVGDGFSLALRVGGRCHAGFPFHQDHHQTAELLPGDVATVGSLKVLGDQSGLNGGIHLLLRPGGGDIIEIGGRGGVGPGTVVMEGGAGRRAAGQRAVEHLDLNGVPLLLTAAVVDVGHVRTVIERGLSDACHALWDGHAGQAGAAPERAGADVGHAVPEHRPSQRRAVLKHA